MARYGLGTASTPRLFIPEGPEEGIAGTVLYDSGDGTGNWETSLGNGGTIEERSEYVYINAYESYNLATGNAEYITTSQYDFSQYDTLTVEYSVEEITEETTDQFTVELSYDQGTTEKLDVRTLTPRTTKDIDVSGFEKSASISLTVYDMQNSPVTAHFYGLALK